MPLPTAKRSSYDSRSSDGIQFNPVSYRVLSMLWMFTDQKDFRGKKKKILHAETEFQEANAKSLKKKFPSTTMNSFFLNLFQTYLFYILFDNVLKKNCLKATDPVRNFKS